MGESEKDILLAKIQECNVAMQQGREIVRNVQREIYMVEGRKTVFQEQLAELEAPLKAVKEEVA